MNEILLSKIKQTRYLKCSINELTTEKEYNFEAWRPYLGDQYYICFIPAIPVRSIINDILLCRWSGRSGRSILPGYSSHPTHHWLASLLPHLVEMAVGRLREDAGGGVQVYNIRANGEIKASKGTHVHLLTHLHGSLFPFMFFAILYCTSCFEWRLIGSQL